MKREARARPYLITFAVAMVVLAGSAAADIYTYTAYLSGANEVPPVSTTASGAATMILDTDTAAVGTWSVQFTGLSSAQTAAGFYDGAAGIVGTLWFTVPLGSPQGGVVSLDLTHIAAFAVGGGGVYVNIHSANFPNGEIRGQFQLTSAVPAEPGTWSAIKKLYR